MPIMASVKFFLFLFNLLFASCVLAQNFIEIEGQCKDGKVVNPGKGAVCPGGPGGPGGASIPAGPPGGKDDGKNCPGGKDDGKGGGTTPPAPAGPTPPAPAGPTPPGGKDDGKNCPGGKDDGKGGGTTPPAPAGPTPPAPAGPTPPGGKDDGKNCPGGKDDGKGGGNTPPAPGGPTPPAPAGPTPPAPAGPTPPAPAGPTPPAPAGPTPPAPAGPTPPGGKDDGKGKGGKDGPTPPTPKPQNKGNGGFFDPPLYGQPPYETEYKGEWAIDNPNCGVNAMQYQLMANNKAVWLDTTNLGPSSRELGPKGNCPTNPDNNNEPDCFAHAVQYNVETGEVASVYVETDPWCSSGHVLPNGDLVSTGGNRMGDRSVRLFSLTDPEPKFREKKNALGAARWYATNCVLDDGSAIIVGGRDSYSYDVMPPTFDFRPKVVDFPFLKQTTEPAVGQGLHVENNLYPFVYMLPDGDVFIFANDRAVIFDPKTGDIIKELPKLEGGSRNYPPSGQSALLPLRLSPDNSKPVPIEIVICGGNQRDAFQNIDPRYTQNRVFTPALADCNRIKPLLEKPLWEKEQDMPSPRVMGDLLILPNAQLLLINGAKKGTSGWDDGEDPNLTPTLYMPENEMGKRFKELNPTTIPRMYHSSSSVLPDGKILVMGSNAHQFYTFDGPFPTELRVEKFTPPYLDPKLDKERPVIKEDGTTKVLKYGVPFKVAFTVKSNANLGYGDVLLTLLYPPFTTHGFSQNQRLLIAGVEKVEKNVITAVAPPSGMYAPPGYYLMFVTHRNIPSKGIWVHLDA